jgi:D-alanyl-D-alanine carboxypeptidase/D-alanyl-D-alanine-endopeptidase (penicillin-binding protein 4)
VVEEVVSAPPLHQVHWGILVVHAQDGRIVYSRNAQRKFVPASNMKVLSTATALSLLGPEFTYETGLWALGALDEQNGNLGGNLVALGSGDPTFSERFHPSATAPFDSLADSLWAGGLRRVEGALVIDASPWDSTTVPDTWMVGNLPGRSAATGGILAVGDGEFVVEVTAAPRAGEPATARWWPVGVDDYVQTDLVTVPEDTAGRPRRRLRAEHLPESHRLYLRGAVPVGAVDTFRVSQRDPVPHAAAELLRSLNRRGIKVEGGVRIVWDRGSLLGSGSCAAGEVETCAGARKLTALRSPPLSDIVEAILEPSQNWMTEQLVRTLGGQLGEEGSWEEGFRVEREFLTGPEVGVDSLDLTLRDGSGLSAYNLVTPRAMVGILRFMRQSPHGEIYRAAMAEPGEEDGTLERRLTGLEGRIFAKTGTITHVNSLSGYLITDRGRELVFSVLTNGSGLSSGVVREGIDRIVEAASHY